MKRFLLLAFAAVVMAAGCKKYDDTDLQNRVGSLENRVTKLEELCKQLNSDISSLQTIVTALQNNDYITSVVPVTQNGEIIGYTISFAKSPAITIFHGKDGNNGENGKDGVDGKDGKDGKDGYTPQIGVRQDTDGIWYWTLDGNWLTDDYGNKIKAEGRDGKDGKDGANGSDGKDGQDGQDGSDGQNGADGKDGQNGADGNNGKDGHDGTDGQDGITPQLKIEDDYWYVSYDNGQSWQKLGKATGDNGKDGENGLDGDSIFSKVEETETEVVFTLTDGTEIRISKSAEAIELDIVFEITDSTNVLPDSTYEIAYTIIGADESTIIDVVAQDNYKAYVKADDYASGKIIVKTPSADLDASRVIVLVSRGTSTIMRVLNFVQSIIIVSDDTVIVDAEGDTVTIDVETNIEYTVDIPENDRSWISVADTRSTTRKETLTFTVAANPNTVASRYSTVTLKDRFGNICQRILFTQKATGYKHIHVDPAGTLYTHISDDEKQNLTGLVITGTLNSSDYKFMGEMSGLNYVDLSQLDDTTIPEACFKDSSIETVILPSGLTIIQSYAFQNSKITSIELPETVSVIGQYAFSNCSNLSGDLVIPDKVEWIYRYAFYGCSGLANHNLVIGKNIRSIYAYAFIDNYYNPIQFAKVYIKNASTADILSYDDLDDMISRVYAFGKRTSGYWTGGNLKYLGVPKNCKEMYKKATGFGCFTTIEEVEF